MTDKEMIEEIAREIHFNYWGTCAKDSCADCPHNVHNICKDKIIAEKLYNKLFSEGSVVLSREEYENLGLAVETIQEYECVNGQPKLIKEKKLVKKLKTDFVDLLNQEIRELQIAQQARKETAKEILGYLIESGVINTAPETIKMYFKENYEVDK